MNNLLSLNELLNKKEELHPDLLRYTSTIKGMMMVRHPLVYSVPHSPMLNALTNQQYIAKKKQLEIYKTKKQWDSYIFLYERPYRFDALLEAKSFGNLDTKRFSKLASEVWIDSENIHRYKKEWISLFKNCIDKNHFMNKREIKLYNKLSNTTKAYRGAINGKNKTGLSYTTDYKVANWFANRFHDNGEVFEVEVRKDKIFACLERRESELIVL